MNKKANIEEVVRALRCSSTAGGQNFPCKDCRYLIKEPIPQEIIKWAKGEEYWATCDCDRIALDAADLLEKFNDGGY